MMNLDEVPESVKNYFDHSRPGWRKPFENPPSFLQRVELVDPITSGSILVRLNCGHDKLVSQRRGQKGGEWKRERESYIEGTEVICDACRNEYKPRLERIHVVCQSSLRS